MNTNFVPTHQYYHSILAAPDAETRAQRYQECFIQPWKPMMDMFSAQFGGGSDPLAGARAWHWLLPDQTAEMANLLQRLEDADAWQVGSDALARAAACFEPYAARLPFDSITGWLVLADPQTSNPFEHGYTGATDWTQPRFVGQFWDPNAENLVLLPGLVAHEMHHLIRLSAFPFGPQTSVADYVVLEGTAESMATALFGERVLGFYVKAFDPDHLDTARRIIGQGLDVTGFNAIRGYIFGDELAARSGATPPGGMPPYGGYAIGYHVVQAFLKRTGATIEEATFLPAQEIVAGSGFFA